MEEVTQEFYNVLPVRKRLSSLGWYNFNCPSCGDKRGRGSFLVTPSGGFRYKCWNAGCEYNTRTTGWEPDSIFGGRARRIFEICGGDIKSIPIEHLFKKSEHNFDSKGNIKETKEVKIRHNYPEIELPEGTDLLLDWSKKSKTAQKVLDYLKSRGEYLCNKHPFLWSKENPYYLLIPYIHYNKIVGYLGRHIYKKHGNGRFIQQCPSDYIFNQDIINHYNARYLFVVESPLDAISLGCVASRSSTMTEKQINLLNYSGKDIVLLPDQKNKEWLAYLNTAQLNKWHVSTPEWGNNIKDVNESVSKNGLLYTVKLIMDGVTDNYDKAKIILNMRT